MTQRKYHRGAVRLSESQLKAIIAESIKALLMENGYIDTNTDWHGVIGTKVVYANDSSYYPYVLYKGELLDYPDLEDIAQAQYEYECHEEGNEPSGRHDYCKRPTQWFESILQDYMRGIR